MTPDQRFRFPSKHTRYDQLFYNQQATMETTTVFDLPDIEEIPVPVKKPAAAAPSSRPTPVSVPQKPKSPTPSVTAQYGVKPASPTIKAEKPVAFVMPDVKDGSIVIHKTFGEGAVTKIDQARKHIRVTFAVGEKTFIFPDAFKNGFLKLKE